jgi:hypothetical protein
MLYYGVWLCSVRRERNKSTTWPIEAQGCMCYTYLYQLGDSPRKLMKWLGAWDFQFVPDPEITELSISKPDYTLNLQVNFLQYTGNHFTKCVAMIKKTCKLVSSVAATTQCKCTLSTRLHKKKKKTPKNQWKKPAGNPRIVNIQAWLYLKS